MVILNMQAENSDNDGPTEEQVIASREERKRTGRYVAVGTAIFLSLLGIYQALLNGTPQYAALFAPAVIMFIYLLWILHASRNQNARLLKQREAAEKAEQPISPITVCEELSDKSDNQEETVVAVGECEKNEKSENVQKPKIIEKDYFNRSYSIA